MQEIERIVLNEAKVSFVEEHRGEVISEVWGKTIAFEKGSWYRINGHSGSGKSTILNLIFGRLKPDEGSLFLNDIDISSLSPSVWRSIRKTNIAYVFQGFKLLDNLTVIQNLQLKTSLKQNSINSSQLDQYLDDLQLLAFKNKRVAQLSFGQQQRLAFIRAICQPFDFLLLDEPFSNLDPHNTDLMVQFLKKELNKQKAGLIMATHAEHPALKFDHVFTV